MTLIASRGPPSPTSVASAIATAFSAGGAVCKIASKAASTPAAASAPRHSKRYQETIVGGTSTRSKVNEVLMPKLPPAPPRHAQ